MTNDLTALRKRLAEFMGYRLHSEPYEDGVNRFHPPVYNAKEAPYEEVFVNSWHPDEDIAQAMMVLAKIGLPWQMHYDCGDEARYCLIIVQGDGIDIDEHARTPELAASLAADSWLRQGER